MKKIKLNYLFLSLLVASLSVTSCSTDDATGDSVIEVNDGAAVVVPVSQHVTMNSINYVNEGGFDKTLTYAVTLQEVQPVDVHVRVSFVSGTATEDEDFEYDHEVVIPAWSLSGEGTITILGDSEVESMETFTLKIGSMYDANIDLADTTVSFEITDYGDLDVTFAWDRTIPGYPFTLCDIGYDVDVLLLDSNGDQAESQVWTAATGDCPETMTLSISEVAADGLVDGEYTIVFNVYDDATLSTAGITPAFDIPMTVTYSRANSPFAGSFVQDAADVIDSDFGNTPNYDTINIYVATLTVENGIYTFSKNGNYQASGRTASRSYVNPSKSRISRPSRF